MKYGKQEAVMQSIILGGWLPHEATQGLFKPVLAWVLGLHNTNMDALTQHLRGLKTAASEAAAQKTVGLKFMVRG